MSFKIHIRYSDIENEYLSDSSFSSCDQSKKIDITFVSGIESTITFFVSEIDKKTLKKLIKILKNKPVCDYKEDVVFLTKNGSALYNNITNEYIFRIDNSKNQTIIYNTDDNIISFCINSKCIPSANIKIPIITSDIKDTIISLIYDMIDIININ